MNVVLSTEESEPLKPNQSKYGNLNEDINVEMA